MLLIRDLAGKFSGSRTFIELLEQAVPYFYEQVGEKLRAYVAPPPKLQRPQGDGEEGAHSEGEARSSATDPLISGAMNPTAVAQPVLVSRPPAS